MSFLSLVNKRYSLRTYSEKPVPRHMIDNCLEAARLAPSACNSQPWRFIVVEDTELKKKLGDAAFGSISRFNHFAFKAPVLVLIVSERTKFSAKFGSIVKKKNFSLIDIGIAAEHFCLQAAEQGLGTCMIGWFHEKNIKKLLSIPRFRRVELMISLGYPTDENVPAKNRKTINEMSGYNEYR